MGTQRSVGLPGVRQGREPSRLRLLAPLRYLAISHPEKDAYDRTVPAIIGLCAWVGFMVIDPKPSLFGDGGLLKYVRDVMIMAVPFMIGALAAVAMGAPNGTNLDRRPLGADLHLHGEKLTLRQFVCYLLGYLCFVALSVLIFSISAELMKASVLSWTSNHQILKEVVFGVGTLVLFMLLSVLSITVLWALYFLTDIVNRPSA